MKWWLAMLLVLTGVGCATTMPVASLSETTVAAADVGEEPTVVVEATSPTAVQYRTEGETVVPIKRAYPAAARIRRRNKVLGMLIGGGIGAVAGALGGNESDRRQATTCEEFCGTGSLVFSVLAMVAGGFAGSLIGGSY
ncbi:MAG TPA: hypothetical protein VIQ54_14045 [Polyangia bacterium]|jgi:hypothetical protein